MQAHKIVLMTLVKLAAVAAALASVGACHAADVGDRSIALQQDHAQWVTPKQNYAGWRHSELDQITTENVRYLRTAWSFSTGIPRGHQGQPLVVGNMMFIHSPFPNPVFAVDLSQRGWPVVWRYTPTQDPRAPGVACCDWISRGLSYADGRIIMNTLDGQVIALDAKTGEELWKVRHTNVGIAELTTIAPFVFDGVVLVGNSGAEFGVRGRVAAYELATGRKLWDCASNGPDEEMCMNPYRSMTWRDGQMQPVGHDTGLTSWIGESWKTGGGTVWGWMTFDPETRLVLTSSGNTSPWSAPTRMDFNFVDGVYREVHDNKWTNSIIARHLDTGEVAWAFQATVGDQWDYAGIQANKLVDLEIPGRGKVQALVRFDRNGFAFVLDRTTGELISADKYFPLTNWATGIDLHTGRPTKVEQYSPFHFGEVYRNVCPSAMGAANIGPGAFSPQTSLFYVHSSRVCMDFEPTPVVYIPMAPFVGANVRSFPAPDGYAGSFFAWDAVQRKKVWEIKDKFPGWSGVLSTGGGLVFYGTLDGWFRAVDKRTGEIRFEQRLSSGIVGSPMSFLGPDGQQYVAIFSGVGGWPGLPIVGGLDPGDPYGALGATNLANETNLWLATNPGSTLYVFALPSI